MSSATAAIERRLTRVGQELAGLREELRVTDEQLQHFAEDASDAELRAIVSENGLDQRAAKDATRTVEAMQRQRRHVVGEIERLERAQDELLDELSTAMRAQSAGGGHT